MSHYRVLMIGRLQDLQNIYDDCADSSSETKAEMAFGYDNLWATKEYEDGKLIYKGTKEYEEIVLGRNYSDCLDIRDRNNYSCIDSIDYAKRKSDMDMREFFEALPEGTTFFIGDAHL